MGSLKLLMVIASMVALVHLILAHSEPCIKYCGDKSMNMVDCPSNYKCVPWGCGTTCLRDKNYQPDYCPMVNCVGDVHCPLGFKRDEKMCEGCDCARQSIVDAIKKDYYDNMKNHSSSNFSFSKVVMMISSMLVTVCVFKQRL